METGVQVTTTYDKDLHYTVRAKATISLRNYTNTGYEADEITPVIELFNKRGLGDYTELSREMSEYFSVKQIQDDQYEFLLHKRFSLEEFQEREPMTVANDLVKKMKEFVRLCNKHLKGLKHKKETQTITKDFTV